MPQNRRKLRILVAERLYWIGQTVKPSIKVLTLAKRLFPGMGEAIGHVICDTCSLAHLTMAQKKGQAFNCPIFRNASDRSATLAAHSLCSCQHMSTSRLLTSSHYTIHDAVHRHHINTDQHQGPGLLLTTLQHGFPGLEILHTASFGILRHLLTAQAF